MTGYQYPDGIQFSPDGSVVYIAENQIDTVTALDFVSRDALYEYPTGNGPYGVTLSTDGRRLYVPNYSADSVSVIGTIQRITGQDRFDVAVSISQRAYRGNVQCGVHRKRIELPGCVERRAGGGCVARASAADHAHLHSRLGSCRDAMASAASDLHRRGPGAR